ncbi:MAG: hypothetical protein KDJ26_00905 [Alphaproteobacteria bacterium]|nr:hypothetical protein [Alphaproteobacteria bacterium]MCB9984573.1 hypothetical protein [Micavibrio sp.]HPQ50276.1 hypothetical protein [Alphaproteobacteria bacterium]HRK97916.1 hypothetical protein [Alphaproteobacteria bacterium]
MKSTEKITFLVQSVNGDSFLARTKDGHIILPREKINLCEQFASKAARNLSQKIGFGLNPETTHLNTTENDHFTLCFAESSRETLPEGWKWLSAKEVLDIAGLPDNVRTYLRKASSRLPETHDTLHFG